MELTKHVNSYKMKCSDCLQVLEGILYLRLEKENLNFLTSYLKLLSRNLRILFSHNSDRLHGINFSFLSWSFNDSCQYQDYV
jgi:hypothetical protein